MMRLLLALLLLCGLALPAVAAPLHCAAMLDRAPMMAHAGQSDGQNAGHGAHHGTHHGKGESHPAGKVVASQDCLGCAALKAPLRMAEAPWLPAADAPVMVRLTPLAGRSGAPDTPPPRTLA